MRRKKHEEKEVDLAALVDILSNMLFFLLATVSFLQLKTLNAAVPAESRAAVDTGKAVDVTLEVTAAGFVLVAQGEAADPNIKFKPVNVSIPRVPWRAPGPDGREDRMRCVTTTQTPPCLDGPALTKELWEIKKQAPETKNIMIKPDQGIFFEDIVLSMDASREMQSIVDPNKKVQLFTRPVLIETVQGDEQDRDDNPTPK